MNYIDIGNSFAKIYNPQKKIFKTIPNKEIIDYLKTIVNEKTYICSVEISLTLKIKKLYPNLIIIDNKIYDKLIKISDPTIYQKGTDRIITGYGAIELYHKDIIVIDLGTCVTVDVYSDKEYKSGYIFPGFDILKHSINKRVNHLPMPNNNIIKSKNVINTSDQMFLGNIYGMIGAINQFVKVEKAKYKKDLKVIITGGTIYEFNQYLQQNLINNIFDFEYNIDERLIFKSMILLVEKGII